MIGSPNYRDLSVESGIVIGAPSEFYPKTTEEPNHTDDRFAEFMVSMLDSAIESGLVVDGRERYYPGPQDTGGGPGYVGELVKLTLENSGWVFGGVGVVGLLFPKQFERIGDRITDGLVALRFTVAWRLACHLRNLSEQSVTLPAYLQWNIEGLCFLDALSRRSATERDMRFEDVRSTATEYASASHPSGLEIYRITIVSNEMTRTYFVNGHGVGVREDQRVRDGKVESFEVDMRDLNEQELWRFC